MTSNEQHKHELSDIEGASEDSNVSIKEAKVESATKTTQIETGIVKDEQQQSKKMTKLEPIAVENSEKVICPTCGKYLANRASYRRHRNSMHLNMAKTYTCPYCQEKMTTVHYTQFYIHRENCMIIYTGKTDNHSCQKCGETFALLKHLEGHKVKCYNKKRKGGWKGHKCDYEGCSFATAHKERLEAHVRTKHLNLPLLLNHICPYCGNKYSGKKGLNSHIESHHTNPDHKPYQCSHCSKPFKTQQLVKMHEKIHSDVLSYMCSFCGKGFKQSAVLYRHKLNCQFKPE